ncbi:hypothetical protein ACOSQ3_032547 [Xanthoceras sorbifolium]
MLTIVVRNQYVEHSNNSKEASASHTSAGRCAGHSKHASHASATTDSQCVAAYSLGVAEFIQGTSNDQSNEDQYLAKN